VNDPEFSLGQGHLFKPVHDSDDRFVGWIHTHPDARNTDVLCQSFCAVRAGFNVDVHQVLAADPLSLSPSLKCRACGSHGHVTNGRWEPCQGG
jgi:hypothetical protein